MPQVTAFYYQNKYLDILMINTTAFPAKPVVRKLITAAYCSPSR